MIQKNETRMFLTLMILLVCNRMWAWPSDTVTPDAAANAVMFPSRTNTGDLKYGYTFSTIKDIDTSYRADPPQGWSRLAGKGTATLRYDSNRNDQPDKTDRVHPLPWAFRYVPKISFSLQGLGECPGTDGLWPSSKEALQKCRDYVTNVKPISVPLTIGDGGWGMVWDDSVPMRVQRQPEPGAGGDISDSLITFYECHLARGPAVFHIRVDINLAGELQSVPFSKKYGGFRAPRGNQTPGMGEEKTWVEWAEGVQGLEAKVKAWRQQLPEVGQELARAVVVEWDRWYLNRVGPYDGLKGLYPPAEALRYYLKPNEIPPGYQRDASCSTGGSEWYRKTGIPPDNKLTYSVNIRGRYETKSTDKLLEEIHQDFLKEKGNYKRPVSIDMPGADEAYEMVWRDVINYHLLRFRRLNAWVCVDAGNTREKVSKPVPEVRLVANLILKKLMGEKADLQSTKPEPEQPETPTGDRSLVLGQAEILPLGKLPGSRVDLQKSRKLEICADSYRKFRFSIKLTEGGKPVPRASLILKIKDEKGTELQPGTYELERLLSALSPNGTRTSITSQVSVDEQGSAVMNWQVGQFDYSLLGQGKTSLISNRPDQRSLTISLTHRVKDRDLSSEFTLILKPMPRIALTLKDLCGNTLKAKQVAFLWKPPSAGGEEQPPSVLSTMQAGFTDENGKLEAPYPPGALVMTIFKSPVHVAHIEVAKCPSKVDLIGADPTRAVSEIRKLYSDFLLRSGVQASQVGWLNQLEIRSVPGQAQLVEGLWGGVRRLDLPTPDAAFFNVLVEQTEMNLSHELSHWLSLMVLDPSKSTNDGFLSTAVKYYSGKTTGHDVWVSCRNYDYPELMAFEEGLAHFLGSKYMESYGRIYDGQLLSEKDSQRYALYENVRKKSTVIKPQVLLSNLQEFTKEATESDLAAMRNSTGEANASKVGSGEGRMIEGNIAAFLGEYYRRQGLNGVQAASAFIRTILNSKVTASGSTRPVRTIREFLANERQKGQRASDVLDDLAQRYRL